MAWEVTYQGGKFSQRGYDMLMEAKRLTPFDIFVSQGGYNAGAVAASAGTHDREAVDIGGSLLTVDQRNRVVLEMRRVGWAAWVRTPAQGFSSYHIHGVPVGGDLSTAARAQVVAYYDGKNGLAGGGPDDGPRDFVGVTWESYSQSSAYRPPIDTSEEDDMTPEQDGRLKNIEKAIQYPGGGGASWFQALANQMGANHAALLKELSAIRSTLSSIEKQGQVPGAGYDWFPALNDKLDAILKRLTP